jgi:hypothetical protein
MSLMYKLGQYTAQMDKHADFGSGRQLTADELSSFAQKAQQWGAPFLNMGAGAAKRFPRIFHHDTSPIQNAAASPAFASTAAGATAGTIGGVAGAGMGGLLGLLAKLTSNKGDDAAVSGGAMLGGLGGGGLMGSLGAYGGYRAQDDFNRELMSVASKHKPGTATWRDYRSDPLVLQRQLMEALNRK